MGRVFKDLRIPIGTDLAEKLKYMVPDYSSHRLLRKSIDARGSGKPKWIYSLEVFTPEDPPTDESIILERFDNVKERPIIVGAGPAGLFAALRFVERGLKPILLERGSPSEKRLMAINKFWRYGKLDPDDNVCFGEGGAGLYSDGKLITRIKSPHIPYVMDRLVQFGAPEEIKYLSDPHVGSDRLRRVIPFLRNFLLENGCEIHFNCKMTGLVCNKEKVTGVTTDKGEFKSEHILLATGHSATKLFSKLNEQGVFMEGKPFAVGFRIEHPQKKINGIQFGMHAEEPELGPANYKLAHHDKASGVGVYSFCMCPGGYVLSSGTEEGGLVSNGMSNYKRNSPYANAAVVVAVDHEKYFGKDLFGGMKFRKAIEEKAFKQVQDAGGTKELPAQNLMDFFNGKTSKVRKGSCLSGSVPTRLDELLPEPLQLRLLEAFEKFDTKMKGFLNPDAQLFGIESRTSCPLRITRDNDTLESISHTGLYPLGEGAGYAGGITSAACDGIKAADKIVEKLTAKTIASQT